MNKNRLLGAACACTFTLLSSISFTADAALMSRLSGQAYYDDVLDITWLGDANFAQTSGFDADGRMSWANANAWAASLTVGGLTDWRLPTISPINGGSFNTISTNDGSTDIARNISRPGTVFDGSTASELAHLFYNTLGNVSDYSVAGVFDDGCAGSCLTNTGPFSNVQSSRYWSGSELDSSNTWFLDTGIGRQSFSGKNNNLFAWAVRSGDVSAVPLPASVWLLGSGLIGLLGLAKRNVVPAQDVLHSTRSS